MYTRTCMYTIVHMHLYIIFMAFFKVNLGLSVDFLKSKIVVLTQPIYTMGFTFSVSTMTHIISLLFVSAF